MFGAPAETVLVCGLGRIGLQCIKALRGYRVPVRAIDLNPPGEVELDPACIVQGDFRRPDTLLKAGIAECRSIVLLAQDTAANVEGALAARRANPHVRLVVRGEQQSLHALLSKQLGNLVVYEPNVLAAPAFAFAALDRHVLAHFYVDQQLFQVVEHTIGAGDPLLGSAAEHAPLSGSQVLRHLPVTKTDDERQTMEFYGWRPGKPIELGDRVLVLSAGRPRRPARTNLPLWRDLEGVRWTLHRLSRDGLSRPTEIALMGIGMLCTLLVLSVMVFMALPPRLSPGEALRLAIMLLTGAHLADIFDPFVTLPRHLMWIEMLLTVTGTLSTAVLYALLTDRLLTARFQLARRPHPPARDHVIVAGLGATGERIASVLQRMHRPVVAIDRNPVDPRVLPKLSVVRGNATDADALTDANLASAHGIVASTPDDLQNVEIALLAASLNPDCRIAVRTFDPRFTENVSFLLPNAKVLCVSSLAATAYAAAALGEHVISLFQLLDTPVLVVEYAISQGDSLVCRPLWEIAEGYSVVPALHQPAGAEARVLSADDANVCLRPGDRLVILATAASLEAIERGDLRPREYTLRLLSLRPYAEPLQVVGVLVHRLGYSFEQAHEALSHLPHAVPQPLYGVYASRIQRLLHVNGVQVTLTHHPDRSGSEGRGNAPFTQHMQG